ncbi:SusC/RagA family TonB-linked outer membrane protein [Cruoricaptor ignavus]|uniref:SusC/RagA family TonB-linked outer membrane protein n=1 Tax=Cruoricaptor ignavus TaxID=1118202 RepID=A0A7M1T0R0_9FLAO|nr:SusC/RagA family TonB-linked outer membrane protein [Cruoricaptor ignavus]QOR73389.1 SusC/RagA family TonB-linked outer membrane protein [Cruoricaptor ignavus]
MNVKLKLMPIGALFFVSASLYGQKTDSVKTKDIEGVVVTALGLKKQARSLTYSTQSVRAEDVARVPTANFTSNLSGKVAGLNIKTSGNIGGSVDVTLRGYRSMTGNNQPLFVIDGTPMINSSNSIRNSGLAIDMGNTISDINPDDIAEMNVLKGAAATALYGSRAANGAIIITTKKGRASKRYDVDLSSSVSVSVIDKETFPKYQTQYGQGYGTGYSLNKGYFDSYNGEPMAPTYEDASYGAAFDPNLLVWQYAAFIPGSPTYGKATPWVAAKNDPSKLFETAFNYNNSVSFSKGNEVSSFRLSYQNVNGTDILPNTYLNKNSITGNASYKIAPNFTASLYATYVDQHTRGKNPTGYHGLTGNFRQWWATNVDIKEQKALYKLTGRNVSWNIKDANDVSPAYWNNVYFQLNENYITDSRQRFAGNFSLNYDINEHFNVVARMSHDGYEYFIDERRAIGSLPDNMSIGPAVGNQPSGYAMMTQRRSEENYDVIGNYKGIFAGDNVTVNALLGTNINVQSFKSNAQGTQGGLFVPGVYSITNSATTPNNPLLTNTTKRIYGIFAGANLGFLNTYYLEGNVRNDTSTALPTQDNQNNYWYYSASGSIVLTGWDFLKDSQVLSFGKLRASYAEVGSDTEANQLNNQYYTSTPFGTPTYYYNTTAKNSSLKPEKTKSKEIGLNLQFFNNRFGFDVAAFQNDTSDQILPLAVSYSSGVLYKFQNVGNMRSEGVEVSLNATPVKTKAVTWDMNINWSNPQSKVTELAEGVENITLGSFQGGVTVNATKGEKFGAIKGSDFKYDGNGNKIVGADGKYVKTDGNSVIGNMQPKWFGSIVNKVSVKQLALSFQVDWREGGDIFSLDQYYGQATGLYPETVFINDLGNPVRNTLANGGGYILPGVKNTGTKDNPVYVQNDIRLDASEFGAMGYAAFPAKQFVYKGTYVKLREVALTYTFPRELLQNTFLYGASLSLVGNNLWIMKKDLPYADPEFGLSAGNVQGYQTSPLPATRTFSLNAKLNF